MDKEYRDALMSGDPEEVLRVGRRYKPEMTIHDAEKRIQYFTANLDRERRRAARQLTRPAEPDYVSHQEVLANRTRRDASEELEKIVDDSKVNWLEVAEAVLFDFPPIGPTLESARKRYKTIRGAGYPVRAYSKLGVRELISGLKRLEPVVRKKAEEYCPDLLAKIDRANATLRQAKDIY